METSALAVRDNVSVWVGPDDAPSCVEASRLTVVRQRESLPKGEWFVDGEWYIRILRGSRLIVGAVAVAGGQLVLGEVGRIVARPSPFVVG